MKTKIFSISALLITLAATALRTFCLLTQYEPRLGYLQSGTFTTVTTVFMIAGALFCFASGFALSDVRLIGDAFSTLARQRVWAILYTFGAAACFFGGVYLLADPTGSSFVFYKLTGILALVLAVFFLVGCSGDKTKSASASAALLPWLPFAGIVMLLLLAASFYFDQSVTINGPMTVPMMIASLFGCFFLLAEVRIRAERRSSSVYTGVTLLAFFLCTTVGVSNLIYSLAGNTAGGISISQPARPILLLAISFAAAARLLCHTSAAGSEEA